MEPAPAARDLLAGCATAHGYVAAEEAGHYGAIWARDGCIASLGALADATPELVDGARRTLHTLSQRMGPLGQVPNTVWPDEGYWDWGENGSVDGTAWFVVAACHFLCRQANGSEATALRASVERALSWLRHQDVTGTGLITSPDAGEWMDSSVNRGGRVLFVNALYAWGLRLAESIDLNTGRGPSFEFVSEAIDAFFWPSVAPDLGSLLWPVPNARGKWPHPALAEAMKAVAGERSYYLSHATYGRFVDVCDVLAQCLAVLAGIASPERASRIFDYLVSVRIARPFPSRVLARPVSDGSADRMFQADADARQDPRWRNPPHEYHNGAVWPYVGGFHAAALARADRRAEAAELLAGLEEANRDDDGSWAFPEWRHGLTGAAGGSRRQAWNAGAYLMARRALEGRAEALL